MAGRGQRQRHQIVTPHSMFLVWNYRDRLSTFEGDQNNSSSNPNEVEPVIISTVSLKQIQTQKSKGASTGSFTVTLAPTKNWVSVLSPGSWCALLMSQERINQNDVFSADPNKVKFFGKIESVRTDVDIDQEDGKRRTVYTVTGVDWGYIFDTTVYIDPLALTNDRLNPNSAKLLLDDIFKSPDISGLPSSSAIVRSLLKLWGNPENDALERIQGELKDNLANAGFQFTLPDAVVSYFGFESNSVAKLVLDANNDTTGTLTSKDRYEEKNDSVGLPSIQSLTGVNTLWSLMTANCNPILNELVNDLDWKDGSANLRLWKRVKPFLIEERDPSIEGDDYLNRIASKYRLVRHTKIPIDRIIHFEAGTNWRDKYNFAEIQVARGAPDTGAIKELASGQFKRSAQIWDKSAFQREGFRPLIQSAQYYLPVNDREKYDITRSTRWKFLMKDWYFDTHRMLNGTVTFIGLNEHIVVGQNILLDARVMGETPNLNVDVKNNQSPHIMAHVEAISHSFTVDDNGTREFFTSISFVRGVVTDQQGNYFNREGVGVLRPFFINDPKLDKDTRDLPPQDDKNEVSVFGTSDSLDPDPQKLRGN